MQRALSTRGPVAAFLAALMLLFAPSSLAADEPAEPVVHIRSSADAQRTIDRETTAIEALLARGNQAGAVDAYLRRAEARRSLGLHGKAIDDANAAISLADRIGDPSRLAAAWGVLAGTAWLTGDAARAREAIDKSRAIAHESGLSRIEAKASIDDANFLAAQGHYTEAVEGMRRAAETAEAAGDAATLARARLNEGRVYYERRNWTAAKETAGRADVAIRGVDEPSERAHLLLTLGALTKDLGLQTKEDALLTASAQTLNAAVDWADVAGDQRTEATARGYLGLLERNAGRDGEAAKLFSTAALVGEELQAPDVEYVWRWEEGRSLVRSGKIEEAVRAFGLAVHAARSLRQNVGGGGPDEARLRTDMEPLFYEYVDLLIKLSEADAAGADAVLREARDTLDALRSKQLADYFQDQCLIDLERRRVDLEGLLAHSAAIYPVVLDDRIVILYETASGIRARTTAHVGREDVRREATALRQRIEATRGRSGDTQISGLARQLYDQLFAAIVDELSAQGVDTLVIVPDGPLRQVPFAALHDGSRYIVDRFAIATVPGLRLLDPHDLDRSRVKPLAAGLTTQVENFPALPHVAEELRSVADLYGGTVILDNDFTGERMAEAIRSSPYSLVHIATHAQFGGDSKETFLLAHDGKLSMSDLERIVRPTAFRDNPLELIVLSGCQTAVGDERAALGLAGIALKAGARSALATMWSIDDEASAQLILEFYRQLATPGVGKAQALRAAQIHLKSEPTHAHPYYWSGFLMIGSWL